MKMDYFKCAFLLATVLFLPGQTTSEPEQIHIGLDSNDSVVVIWSSHERVTGIVEYSVTSGDFLFRSNSNVSTLPVADVLAARYIHRAKLKNLTAETNYFYRIVSLSTSDGKVLNTSKTYNFTLHTKRERVKFLVFGDMGADDRIPTYRALERHVTSQEYAAILHVGDFAYYLHSHFGETGDKFMNNIQPFAARVPYMTSPGNQEIPDNFVRYRTRFSHPDSPWPIPVDKMWYSYDVGPVHFVSYSTEVFFSDYSKYVCTQFDWLLKDLQRANKRRGTIPWIIAIGHRPMYCSNANRKDCTNTLFRRWIKHGLENLFYTQGVDLVIQAHQHSYERLWPMYDGTVTSYDYVNPRAPTHVISGAAGNKEYVNWMPKGDADSWSAFRADATSHYSFGILDVHNHTHLRFDQVSSETENVLDSFWLVQNKHGPFVPNITCSGRRKHSSCICPSPYFYIYYIVIMAISVILLIVVLILVMRFCRRRCKRKNNAAFTERRVTFNNIVCYLLKVTGTLSQTLFSLCTLCQQRNVLKKSNTPERYLQVHVPLLIEENTIR